MRIYPSVKNPGIGRGGRPGMMPPAKRFTWLYEQIKYHGPTATNDRGLMIKYLAKTRINNRGMLAKDLTMMWELGYIERVGQLTGQGWRGKAFIYAAREKIEIAA